MEASLRYGDIEFTMNASPSPSPISTRIISFSIIASGFSCRASLGKFIFPFRSIHTSGGFPSPCFGENDDIDHSYFRSRFHSLAGFALILMIFHFSFSLTCCSQKICFCDLGFNNGLKSKKVRENFSIEVDALEAFLKKTWTVRIREETGSVQFPMPRVVQRQVVEVDVVAAL